MNQKLLSCKSCGKCCYYEIPLTILDLHRIAESMNISDEKSFNLNVQTGISDKTGLFKLKKKSNRACIHLTKENRCSIHETKPNACKFYLCNKGNVDNEIPWTAKIAFLASSVLPSFLQGFKSLKPPAVQR